MRYPRTLEELRLFLDNEFPQLSVLELPNKRIRITDNLEEFYKDFRNIKRASEAVGAQVRDDLLRIWRMPLHSRERIEHTKKEIKMHFKNIRKLTKNPGNSPLCPICGATELDSETGFLNVRALKSYDEYGAWSQCLKGPHISEDEEGEVDLGTPLWFAIPKEFEMKSGVVPYYWLKVKDRKGRNSIAKVEWR